MGKPKIDRVKLSQMLRDGKTQRDIAESMGVSEAAISKAKKELNINVVKSVALENAHRVVDKSLNAVDQLQKINGYANELLDLLMRWQRGDDEALQILESQVKMVRVGKGEEAEWVKEYKFKDPRELALKAMGEIRSQLRLELEIFQTLYDLRAVQEFQQEVLTAIGEVNLDVRRKIINRLQERSALRRAINFG